MDLDCKTCYNLNLDEEEFELLRFILRNSLASQIYENALRAHVTPYSQDQIQAHIDKMCDLL